MSDRAERGQFIPVAIAVLASVLSHTLLIPTVRPFMSWAAPGHDGAVHAFMSLALMGGVAGPLLVRRISHLIEHVGGWIAVLTLADAALLGTSTLRIGVGLLLALRVLQGGFNVAALSLLLGAVRAPREKRTGSGFGLLGAAMMLGVALGAPLGTLALRLDVRAPLLFGAALEVLVAVLAMLMTFEVAPGRSAKPTRPLVSAATFWVFGERFAVGCLVVTFALHGRACLGLTDSEVGACFSWFLLPFVACIHPAGWLADCCGARLLARVGLGTYGAGFWLLAIAAGVQTPRLMLLLGVASAAVFAAAMREAGSKASSSERVAAMSSLNAAGSLGMLLGTALSGMLSAGLRRAGVAQHGVHEMVFVMAGALPLLGSAAFAERGRRADKSAMRRGPSPDGAQSGRISL